MALREVRSLFKFHKEEKNKKIGRCKVNIQYIKELNET